ncbi:hypothetical protein BX600DRAFT_518169 [Xylariales sp. PMI_506]|nr:hypothetical protein BX600DRAFT_518169 [Xylariales sp. PMI_506]
MQARTPQSLLGQSVRHAQALGLDKLTTKAQNLNGEMMRRVFWDICDADTQPMLLSYLCKVPFPSNCDEEDATPSCINEHPLDRPTVMSMNILRTRVLKVLNGLFREDGIYLKDYKSVSDIHCQVQDIMTECKTNMEIYHRRVSNRRGSEEADFTAALWKYHVFNSFCLCADNPAAESALNIYMVIREQQQGFANSPKFRAQVFQNFQVAVVMAMLPTRFLSNGSTSKTPATAQS